jgi:hypothetical protein
LKQSRFSSISPAFHSQNDSTLKMVEREFEAIPCYQILKILSNQAYFGYKRTTIQYLIGKKKTQIKS